VTKIEGNVQYGGKKEDKGQKGGDGMRRIFITLVLLIFIFPVLAFAGEYVLIKGKGVEVCEVYGKNLNSLKLKVPMKRERKFNPEFTDFGQPEWEGGETFDQKLSDKINSFLWERDVNPIYYFPVTEYKNWKGTPEQYAQTWKRYKQVRQRTLAMGPPISRVDIDNDGKVENIYLESKCKICENNGIPLVLNYEKTNIDFEKTSLLLQHPSRKTEGDGILTDDGKKVSDAVHSIFYDVFIYKQKTYFDLYIDLHHIFIEKESRIWGKLQPPAIITEKSKKRKATEPDGILRVFIIENQKTQEICTYHYR